MSVLQLIGCLRAQVQHSRMRALLAVRCKLLLFIQSYPIQFIYLAASYCYLIVHIVHIILLCIYCVYICDCVHRVLSVHCEITRRADNSVHCYAHSLGAGTCSDGVVSSLLLTLDQRIIVCRASKKLRMRHTHAHKILFSPASVMGCILGESS